MEDLWMKLKWKSLGELVKPCDNVALKKPDMDAEKTSRFCLWSSRVQVEGLEHLVVPQVSWARYSNLKW